MKKGLFARWRTNFLAGLAVMLPGLLSLVIVFWILDHVTDLTNYLLIFFPRSWTHKNGGEGEPYWFSTWLAFLVGVLLITLVGRMARVYMGQQAIKTAEALLMKVPLVNKIYGTIKQVNEAFSSGTRSTFKQVVLIEYPRQGIFSLGFITNDQPEMDAPNLPGRMVSIFVPTTPNPTSGFIVLVPSDHVTRLRMPVSDAIRFIISLGSLSPEQQQAQVNTLAPTKT